MTEPPVDIAAADGMHPADPGDWSWNESCREPEHWLYWRTLVEARVAGWDTPARGWFEASRYGVA
jgi:hypothetical protein